MSTKVALIQPVVPAGKTLGIEKAPESIMALAGQLENCGCNVQMFHFADFDRLVSEIRAFSPNFVGISTMTCNYPEGRRIAQALKQGMSAIPIILGGWHASGCIRAYELGQETESLTELLNADSPFNFVIAGEGEDVLPELIRRLEKGIPIKGLPGVSFYRDGIIHVGSSAPRIKDPGRLAWPSWNGLNVNCYRDKRTGALDLSVHFNRGCRFRCSYCATPMLYGRGVKTTPAEEAVGYLEFLLEKFHPQVITFTDEDFFGSIRWVKQLVSLMEKAAFAGEYGVTFDTFASVNDLLHLEKTGQGNLLNRMRKVGFGSFTIGIENFNPKTLLQYNKEAAILAHAPKECKELYPLETALGKGLTLQFLHQQQVQAAINFAHKHGFLVIGDYILGNLGESADQVQSGFEIFSQLKNLMVAYLPVFTPFPGISLWQTTYHSGRLERKSNGRIDWERFDANGGALDLGYDIASLRNELELDFYTSDRYTQDMLKLTRKLPQLKEFFLGRFKYLNQLFPNDQRVLCQLARLSA